MCGPCEDRSSLEAFYAVDRLNVDQVLQMAIQAGKLKLLRAARLDTRLAAAAEEADAMVQRPTWPNRRNVHGTACTAGRHLVRECLQARILWPACNGLAAGCRWLFRAEQRYGLAPFPDIPRVPAWLGAGQSASRFPRLARYQ
jgi:hypothetical protein